MTRHDMPKRVGGLTKHELMGDQRVICLGRVDNELVAQRKVVVQGTHDSAPGIVQLLEKSLDVGDELIA